MIPYEHFPVLAVMTLFMGAFLVVVFGTHRKTLRIVVTMLSVIASFCMVCALIKPVLLDGEIISYWMGDWTPVSGYAIGIGYEVDQLGLFFGLLVVFTVLMSAIYSIRYMERDDCLDRYYTLFLMMSGSVLGLVLTGDIFNMFIMIEIMTFTSVALTAFRNRSLGALEASFKYLVTGSLGSGFTLFGIALLYAQCHTLNMAQVSSILSGGVSRLP